MDYIFSINGLMILVIFLCYVANFSIIWGNRTFSVKTLNQIIFHLKVPMDGTDEGIFKDLFLNTFFQSVILTLITFGLLMLVPDFTNNNQVLIIVIALVFIAIRALINYQIPGYIYNLVRKSKLYENNYVDPEKLDIEFPKNKRNLIHIYLESVENTYSSKQDGGGQDEDYMPELTLLAKENINFSCNDKNGGALTTEGTQWTIASQVSQEAGVPLLLPFYSSKYNDETPFFTGLCSIGELLKKEGYHNEIIMGSQSRFAGTYNFYKQHGDYEIIDHDEALKHGRLPEGYHVFWGYEDKKVFEFAKEDITKLVKENKLFNLDIVTIDTHTPDGYVCECCEDKYDNQYNNVIACQSKMVNEFVSWAKSQDWYANTTIVITGDHNSMSEKNFKGLDKDYVRTPYNCFINSAVSTDMNKNRNFAVYDFYPTILSSLGAKIPGERLGIGTNLFSSKQTLMEEMGYKNLCNEIIKTSKFYNQYIIKGEE